MSRASWLTTARIWSPSAPASECRLRWHLHELFPRLVVPSRALRRYRALVELEERLCGQEGTVAGIARELVMRCRELTLRARDLEHEITTIVCRLAPLLLTMPGCGPLSAAKLVGETAGAGRLRSKAAFARWNGTAPIPAWSGFDRARSAFSPAAKNCSCQRSISAILRPCLRAVSAAEVSPLAMLSTIAALRFAAGALHLVGNVRHLRHLLRRNHHGCVLRVAPRIRGAG